MFRLAKKVHVSLQVGACWPKGQAHVLEFKVQGHMFEF
jgi:hypothetical protein